MLSDIQWDEVRLREYKYILQSCVVDVVARMIVHSAEPMVCCEGQGKRVKSGLPNISLFSSAVSQGASSRNDQVFDVPTKTLGNLKTLCGQKHL